MNRRLVVYADTDFLMAGVKPFDTFMPVTVRDTTRLPLYFFVDPASNRVFYGERYRQEYADGQPNTYGDLLTGPPDDKRTFVLFGHPVPLVELLKPVMDDIRRQYLTILGELVSHLDTTAPVPLSLVFSDNVPPATRQAVSAYLGTIGYEVDAAAFVPAEMLALSLFGAGKLVPAAHKKVVVAEAFNDNLNYSLVQCYNASAVERIAAHTFPGMGIDSRVSVVARLAVDYINQRRRLLHSKDDIEKEVKRHYRVAQEWLRQLDNDARPFLDVKTDFAIERGGENTVVLRKDEIEQRVTFHVRTLGQSYEQFLGNQNHRPDDVDGLVLLGESLRNSQELRQELARFGTQKLMVCEPTDENGLLNGVFLRKQYQEKPQSVPLPPQSQPSVGQSNVNQPNTSAPTAPPDALPFEQVVVTTQLTVGQQLEIGWNDRLIRVLFLGNSRFTVVRNHNSQILASDQFDVDTLLLGQRPVFRNVIRNGRSMGDYQPSGPLNVLRKISGKS
ncbi:MAG: hypothetical protein MUD08_12470 [Cytophagales bacterium]|jgi:hypothetical protein|nr:hypothetical protein [Cytophagales bacterium]